MKTSPDLVIEPAIGHLIQSEGCEPQAGLVPRATVITQ